MTKRKLSHTAKILKKFLNDEAVTASDVFASNSNQYFGKLKKQGIELIEIWKPNLTNAGRHKERRLNPDSDNIKRAKDYFAKLIGKSGESQGSH